MNQQDLLEKAQRFLRVNGVWDMSYGDGRKLSQRLAEFVEEELDHHVPRWTCSPFRNTIITGLRDATPVGVPCQDPIND